MQRIANKAVVRAFARGDRTGFANDSTIYDASADELRIRGVTVAKRVSNGVRVFPIGWGTPTGRDRLRYLFGLLGITVEPADLQAPKTYRLVRMEAV